MKILTYISLYALSLSVLHACKKEQQEFTDSPIIEAYLESGNFVSVKISRQIPFSSDVTYSADDINQLTVNFEYNNTTYLLHPVDSGRYVDSSLFVQEGAECKISFVYNSKNVSAYTYIPAKPVNFTQSATSIAIERQDSTSGPPTSTTMPNPISLTWDNSDVSYYLLVIENMEATLDPIRDFGGNAPPGNRFRKSPTNSSSEEINSREFQYYGKHRIILYHVLPDYATLYEQNSTSSQNLTNPSTSITNGYGIFTGMNSDTLYIQVNEL